jgi:hypothetical protein
MRCYASRTHSARGMLSIILVYAAEGKDSARLPGFWGEPPFDYYLHDGYNTPCLPSLQHICAIAHKPHCHLLPAAVLRSPFMLSSFQSATLYWALA